MLIKRHDAAQDDGEWRAFLAAHDFGELIASGRGHDVPVVVPTHFIFDGAMEITLHLAKPNPVWERLEQNPLAIVSVFGAYTYIPTGWNADAPVPPEEGVPTSYYAAVQAVLDQKLFEVESAGSFEWLDSFDSTEELVERVEEDWDNWTVGEETALRLVKLMESGAAPFIRQGIQAQVLKKVSGGS